jgi:hypothetical protein
MSHLTVIAKRPIMSLREPEFLGNLTHSSTVATIADDSLKDADNLNFLGELNADDQWQWIRRIRWIRLADRAAEAEMLNENEELLNSNEITEDFGPARLEVWRRYLKACADYHGSSQVQYSLESYLVRAAALSGSIFQLFPFVPDRHLNLFSKLGVMDQFYNDLRDLRSDLQLGGTVLPEVLLPAKKTKLIIEALLPSLKIDDCPPDLHYSLKAMISSCRKRYRRIETIYCLCEYDPEAFHMHYWQ